MAYEVLARKWRPRRFEDVVGQQHVTRTLCNAIRDGRIAHAYLFVGPRGIGKTSLARIFAGALNCEKGPADNPCGVCNSCREIASGSNLDVLEIDGASNNRVDEVRDLRENVKFLPVHGRFKLYIIDEVHMLTAGAFNALLKTLEEPPPHVKFIFATTEPQKILPTILSRCQRFDLRRISVADIVQRLRVIAEAENITADDVALAALARAAEGSLRDAVSSLDQLRAFKGDVIEEQDVLSVFGLVSRRTLRELVDAVLAGDVKRIIDIVHQLDGNGKDMQRLVVELLDYFRNLLVLRYAPEAADDGGPDDDAAESSRQQAQNSDAERLLRIIDLLIDAEPRLRYALSRRTLMETVLIRCARAAVTVSIDGIIERLDAMGGFSHAAPDKKKVLPVNDSAVKSPEKVPDDQDDSRRLIAAWPDLVEKIGRMAPLARSALLDSRPLAVEGGKVVVGLDPEFADELQRLQHVRTQRALQLVLEQFLGAKPKLEMRLLTETERSAGDAHAGTPPGHASASGNAPVKPDPANQPDDWRKESSVRDALEIFRGTVIEVRK